LPRIMARETGIIREVWVLVAAAPSGRLHRRPPPLRTDPTATGRAEASPCPSVNLLRCLRRAPVRSPSGRSNVKATAAPLSIKPTSSPRPGPGLAFPNVAFGTATEAPNRRPSPVPGGSPRAEFGRPAFPSCCALLPPATGIEPPSSLPATPARPAFKRFQSKQSGPPEKAASGETCAGRVTSAQVPAGPQSVPRKKPPVGLRQQPRMGEAPLKGAPAPTPSGSDQPRPKRVASVPAHLVHTASRGGPALGRLSGTAAPAQVDHPTFCAMLAPVGPGWTWGGRGPIQISPCSGGFGQPRFDAPPLGTAALLLARGQTHPPPFPFEGRVARSRKNTGSGICTALRPSNPPATGPEASPARRPEGSRPGVVGRRGSRRTISRTAPGSPANVSSAAATA